MKMQKSVIFVKKNLKIDIRKIKNIVKLEIIVIGEYRGATHSICNLKYNVPKKIHIVFHNGSNYDYYFIIKVLAEELKKTIYLFRRKYRKIHNLCISNRKRNYKN